MPNLRRWLPGNPVGAPRNGHVDVWIVALNGELDNESRTDDLALSEMERARRLRFDADRRRFVESHVVLRQILGRCLGISPREIVFCAGPYGKPFVDPARHGTEIGFNISHAGELALIAVSRGLEVGIDVELRRPLPDLEALIARSFSPHERAALAALPAARQLQAFFDYWTLKEAYLKACGDGLNRRLDAFDIAFDRDAPPRLLKVRDRPGDERRWALALLEPAAGYAAALVTESRDPEEASQR